jgi:hypothetical protein
MSSARIPGVIAVVPSQRSFTRNGVRDKGHLFIQMANEVLAIGYFEGYAGGGLIQSSN